MDVAKFAGVSQSTVSMVLNQKNDVSFGEETREKVLKAAASLGYELPKKQKKNSEHIFVNVIVIMCPNVSNPYYTMLIESLNRTAQKFNYHTVVAVTARDPQKEKYYLNLFSKSTLAGVVYLYPSTWISKIQELHKQLPVVFISDRNDGLDVDIVALSSWKTGWIAMDHLLSLAHKKVAYISSPLLEHEIARNQRLLGVKARMKEANLSESNLHIRYFQQQDVKEFPIERFEYLNGYHLTKQVLDEQLDISAFIGTNDMVALGILDAIKERKLKIPQDYSICGCDNTPISSNQAISLTTIDHAIEAKGEEAIKIILQKINLPKETRRITTRLEYDPILIARTSTSYNQKF